MGICTKLNRYLSMLTYIYLNVDECWLTYYMLSKGLNSKFLLIIVKFKKSDFLKCVNVKGSFDMLMVWGGGGPRFFNFQSDWVPIFYLNTIWFLLKKLGCLFHI